MLYIVLALVVAAFGLLIAALTTANTLWAWASVVVSVVAAGLLVMDWVTSRRKKAARGDGPERPKAASGRGPRRDRDMAPAEDTPYGGSPYHDDEFLRDESDHTREPAPELPPNPALSALANPASNLDFEPPVKLELPAGPEDERTLVTEAVSRPGDDGPADDFAGEPGEEPTDASDLLVVAGLDAEVRVVDEHPRYHLATCVWLANRPTIPIPVSEARQLGFTPCARCGPDGVLAARHRAAR